MKTVNIINLVYLLSAVLFIVGLKGLTHPRTAVRGNKIGAFGMLLAVVVTLFDHHILSFTDIIIGVAIGAIIGALAAIKVKMTKMPELVAVFNGFGGAASALVAAAAFLPADGPLGYATLAGIPTELRATPVISIGLAALIGALTLTGSLIAYAKLAELDWRYKFVGFFLNRRIPGGRYVNAALLLVCLALTAVLVSDPNLTVFWILMGVALVLGLTLTIPIGGGDMPVVIALMNSYSGLAAAAAGFVMGNNSLIIAGSLVGSSGVILTVIMCKAMNRSLTNVLFGGVGVGDAGPRADVDEIYKNVKSTSGDEVAMLLEDAQRVVVVPGYGMAVAQAQHAVRDLMNKLEEMGAEVEFGIHPVAGRMPGHMNVLLAESDVPYDKLIEMDNINPTMAQCDVAIVIGANDVVNPDARTDPNSPLAGMPIIDVDKARTAVIIKRSLSPGFAKVPNPLFAADKTLMLFGDGKKAIIEIMEGLKEL